MGNPQDGEGQFLYVVALQINGTPLMYAVLYWAIDLGFLSENSTDPALRLLRTYVDLPVEEKPCIVKKVREESLWAYNTCSTYIPNFVYVSLYVLEKQASESPSDGLEPNAIVS